MDNNANNARRMYFIYVVNAKKGHLKGADKSTFFFCRQLGLICYLKDPDWIRNRIRNGSGIGTAKKKWPGMDPERNRIEKKAVPQPWI